MIRLLAILLAVLFAACGSRMPEENNGALTANAWQAESIAGQGVSAGVASYVVFGEEGRVSGLGACNRFSGSYRLASDSLHIGPITSTEIACSPPVMEQEVRFLAALEETQGYDITEDGFLVLLPSPSGTPTRLAPRVKETPEDGNAAAAGDAAADENAAAEELRDV